MDNIVYCMPFIDFLECIMGNPCSSQATVGQSKNNLNYKDCSLENAYAADSRNQKSSCI